MGGLGAELGLRVSRENQGRPPPCSRPEENGARTANCPSSFSKASAELFDPSQDDDAPAIEVPPTGKGAGGGAVVSGISSGTYGPRGPGSPPAAPRTQPAVRASLLTKSPTQPTTSVVWLERDLNNSPVARVSPTARRRTPSRGAGSGSTCRAPVSTRESSGKGSETGFGSCKDRPGGSSVAVSAAARLISGFAFGPVFDSECGVGDTGSGGGSGAARNVGTGAATDAEDGT